MFQRPCLRLCVRFFADKSVQRMVFVRCGTCGVVSTVHSIVHTVCTVLQACFHVPVLYCSGVLRRGVFVAKFLHCPLVFGSRKGTLRILSTVIWSFRGDSRLRISFRARGLWFCKGGIVEFCATLAVSFFVVVLAR